MTSRMVVAGLMVSFISIFAVMAANAPGTTPEEHAICFIIDKASSVTCH